MKFMNNLVDLHCHWVAEIDDGARTPEQGVEILAGLRQLGFSLVVATPHMRPGMFDNDRAALTQAFDAMKPHVDGSKKPVPETALSSEHYFDDVVFGRLLSGEGLPYPGASAVLVELWPQTFPRNLAFRFSDLKRKGLTPVLAHPERYEPVWRDDECLTPLLDVGAHLLLDVCSLVGKYGRAPQRAAEKLLEEEAYEAACTDAHRPADVEATARAIDRLVHLVGPQEASRLFADGPLGIMGGPRGPSPRGVET